MPLSPQSSRDTFDIIRGWPKGGAVEKSASVAVTDPVTELVEGDFVTLDTDGKWAAQTGDAAAEDTVWCVIEGNKESDSYSGNYLGKCVAITGPYEVKTVKFTSGAYTIGAAVGVKDGVLDIAAANPKGTVTAYDATAGVLTVVMK